MPRKVAPKNGSGGQRITPTQYLLERLGGTAEEFSKEQAHWSMVDCEIIREFLSWWVDKGGALILGRSRDGFSLNITLLEGGMKKTYWFPKSEVMDDEIWALFQELKALAAEAGED